MATKKIRSLTHDWQIMLRCLTGSVFLSYHCKCSPDKKAMAFLQRGATCAGESFQVMPAPGQPMNEHPFWSWYLEKKPQFYQHVEDAAAALAMNFANWQNKTLYDLQNHLACLSLDDETIHGKRRVRHWKRAKELLATLP